MSHIVSDDDDDDDIPPMPHLWDLLTPQGVKPKLKMRPKPKSKLKSIGRQRASKVWDYFTKISNVAAECKACSKVIKSCGNTTNLFKHLETHTYLPAEEVTTERRRDESVIVEYSYDDNSSFIDALDVNIPDIFDLSNEINTSNEATEVISPPIIVDDLEYQRFIETLTKIETIDDDLQNLNITNYLLRFLCVDCHPYDIIQGKGFKDFMQSICPLYKIPTNDQINHILHEKYELMKAKYIQKFYLATSIVLACNTWYEQTTSRNYLAISVIFLDNGIYSSICIAVYLFTDDGHATNFIARKLDETINSWKIVKKKVTAILTDNSDHVVKAVTKHFNSFKHVPCFKNSLGAIKEIISRHSSVVPVLDKVRSILRWIQNNETVREYILHKQSHLGHVQTRIYKLNKNGNEYSTYEMLKYYLGISEIINNIILEQQRAPSMPTMTDIEIIKDMLLLLNPLKCMIKEVSDSIKMSGSKVIPMINCLIKHYMGLHLKTEVVKSVKSKLIVDIPKIFNLTDLGCPVLALATLLDPRFKHHHFSGPHIFSRARRALVLNLKTSPKPVFDEYDFWSHHKNLIQEKAKKNNRKGQSKNVEGAHVTELLLYLETPVSPLSSTLELEWEKMKSTFPSLYKEASKYFPLPACLMPLKKVILVDSFGKKNIEPDQMMKCVFLGNCKDEDWF